MFPHVLLLAEECEQAGAAILAATVKKVETVHQLQPE
jgi:hypothetical protein